MRTTRERLESEKVLAQMGLMNAAAHVRHVRAKFGRPSIELTVAEALEEAQRVRFLRVADALIDVYASGAR